MGRGQERDMERVTIFAFASLCVYPGFGPRQGAVRITFHESEILLLTAFFRWFCEPAYEKLRGTEEGIVNRYVSAFVFMHL